MRIPQTHDPWIRWIILFAAIWIGVAVVRGITFALTAATGLPVEVLPHGR
jgi:hypothetical protein